MNDLQVFNNNEFGMVRTVEIDGKPYFIANDVAKALGYARPADAITAHCKGSLKHRVLTIGGEQEVKIITEGDVYRLIIRSNLPSAEKFESWVFDEVIPTIRRTGGYQVPQTYAEALRALADQADQAERLALENSEMKPKAEYFDALVDRNLLTNFRDTAKELGIQQSEFIAFLETNGYIYHVEKGIRPYADKNDGLFEIKEFTAQNSFCGLQTLITPKGRETFRLLLKKEEI